jgi:hypothetical protein
MAQAVGNKAKGRQHSRQAARRAAKRITRARRKLERKRKLDAKVAAKKLAGIVHRESPSDQRRRAARLRGNISDRKHIPFRKPKPAEATPAKVNVAAFVMAAAVIGGAI